MIISRSALILILACAAVSVSVVSTSQKTLGLRRELAKVQEQIEAEREMIAVLESEWELFTAPPSLQKKLASSPSALAPLTAGQIIASATDIPTPPPVLLIDGPRVTQMVSVEGLNRLVPLPAHKPGIRVRPSGDVLLAAIKELGFDAAIEPAMTITAPKPGAAQPVRVAEETDTEQARPASPLPGQPDDDAIGKLLIDLTLARDALAEVPSQ